MSESKMWTIELETSLKPMQLYRLLEKLHDDRLIGFFYIQDFAETWKGQELEPSEKEAKG